MGITPEDSASVLFDTDGRARGVFTVSQVSAGYKNRLSFEVNESQASARWDGDAPNDL
jgi:predicted dehydrogenase